MRVLAIDGGTFKLDGGAMFGVVPKSIWQKQYPADENNLCTWAMRLLYVEIGQRRILIDTGMGNKQDAKFMSHYQPAGGDLRQSLAAHGVIVEQITDVLLTHLHFDHCGGAVERVDGQLKMTFPNAIYWSNRRHWEWATRPNDREKASFLTENILPIAESGQLEWIEDSGKWLDEIKISFFHGHTEAMMVPIIQTPSRTIVYCADLLPSVAHIPLPYIMGYDTRPLETLTEKQQFLKEAAGRGYTLLFEHDYYHSCCTVEHTDKGVRMKEIFSLPEALD